MSDNNVIIKFGFQPIMPHFIRKSAFSKGKLLVESNHVFDVVEKRILGQVEISGNVIRQTSVNVEPYKVTLQISKQRRVEKATCTCKAGISGFCKHVTALILYINSDICSSSKTDSAQAWGKPTEGQRKKYCKAQRVEDMFPQNKNPSSITILEHTPELSEFASIHCSLRNMLLAEKENANINAVRTVLKNVVDKVAQIRKLEDCSETVNFILQQQMTNISTDMLSAILNTLSPDLLHFYQQNIDIDLEGIKNVCVQSIEQSTSCIWKQERYKRISASTKAHHVYTRKKNFDSLAERFLSTDMHCTAAMAYGLKHEAEALQKYSSTTGSNVKCVGLLISYREPWLCCSPDAVVFDGKTLNVVEIKCPYSCRKGFIIDRITSKPNVGYLNVENDIISLKERHIYYTQIQINMYVTCSQKCDLFVYSRNDFILVNVQRDDNYIARLLPKLRSFYFNVFLPKLSTK